MHSLSINETMLIIFPSAYHAASQQNKINLRHRLPFRSGKKKKTRGQILLSCLCLKIQKKTKWSIWFPEQKPGLFGKVSTDLLQKKGGWNEDLDQ